jgi:anti-anti-sigma factor
MNELLAVTELPGALVVRVVGAADLAAAEAGRLENEAAALPQRDLVVLDVSQVRRLDASTVGALVRWERRLAEEGHQLRIASPGREVSMVLELLRLHRLFEIYEDVDEALQDHGSDAW